MALVAARADTAGMRALVWIALSLAACSGAPSPDEPGPGRERLELPRHAERLVFAEEFDVDGAPDPANWGYEVGRIRNGELQHYTAERRNARIANGVLVIEAHREDHEGASFTAASVITKGKATFRHARIEVRAKMPRGRGVWPAIWLLGVNFDEIGWPQCGEIDVMEFVGFEPRVVHANVHSEAYNHMRGNGRGTRIPLADPSDAFHVYGVAWDRERMVFTLDGAVTFTVANDGTGVASWPFDQPFYLLLNLAVGGSWGGQQGVDESVFPQRLEIDWVRVWERGPAR
ncbi:MAG: glycoside hydrolase family 16 protein [Planctomycetota bacterium]